MDVKGKASRLKGAVLARITPKASKAKASKASPGSEVPPDAPAADVGETTHREELEVTPVSNSKAKPGLDPMMSAAVLGLAILALWRPSVGLVMFLITCNLALAFAVVTLCVYISSQKTVAAIAPNKPQEELEEQDVKATEGLQQLLSPGWVHMRGVIAKREFQGLVSAIDLGEQPPEVRFVRSVASPCEGVVCYNVGLHLLPSKSQTYVQVAVPIPGYAAPWVFKLKLLLLEITVQLYFWSVPPAGRGSGRAYSLIEAALCQEPASKPQVKVALDPVSKSPLLENLLARCEPIASAVICAHLLPRFTGFPNRVILEEGQAVVAKAKEDDTWQQNARRAGWQPRAEAAVEKAVSEMFVEAGGFAYEAMASTAAGAIQILESPADAASAMAGAAYGSASSAARMLKSSFGMEG